VNGEFHVSFKDKCTASSIEGEGNDVSVRVLEQIEDTKEKGLLECDPPQVKGCQ
jgi:hypothetical protein